MNKLLIIILALTCNVCIGQNLIPNPSFEDTVSCPSDISQINLASGWSDFRPTCDFFHSCNTYLSGSTYANIFGHQYPRTGNAYAGMSTYLTSLPNRREMIGIQLKQTLDIGQKYYVKMFISRARKLGGTFTLNSATNKFGARFSKTPYSAFNMVPIDNYAQVYSDSIISDTTNWVLISGSFIADSSYNYVSFGNFFTDSLTSVIHFDTNSLNSYYFIDDVSVSTDSLFTVDLSEIKQNENILVFPNPFDSKVTFKLSDQNESTVSLFNFIGQPILHRKFINSTTINMERFADGVYFYVLRNNEKHVVRGKIIKN